MSQEQRQLPPKGESITIRDFHGKVIDTVTIDAQGNFLTRVGSIKREEFGEYVLHASGHPTGS